MFEVSVAVNNIVGGITTMPLLGALIKNPLYTALLITVCILVIILIIFRNAETDESLLMLGVRSSFYVFIVTIAVIFLHKHVLLSDMAKGVREKNFGPLFDNDVTKTPGY